MDCHTEVTHNYSVQHYFINNYDCLLNCALKVSCDPLVVCLITFSSLCLLSCSSNLCCSTSSAFRSSWNALCWDRRFASSSSSITSNKLCSIVLPINTSSIGFTSMSKSNSYEKVMDMVIANQNIIVYSCKIISIM